MSVKSPLLGPTFPSVATPVKTSEWHMLIHDTVVPVVQKLHTKLHRVEVPNETGAQHNPGVYVKDGGLGIVIRVLHGLSTTNYAARIGKDWRLVGARKMIVPPKPEKGADQIEDLRVFSWKGRLWAIAAAHNGAIPTVAIRQALLELSDDGGEVLRVHVQTGPRHEKNWMPCVHGDDLRLVYSTDPLVTLRIEQRPSGYAVSPTVDTICQTTGHVRGGSQLVPWGDGWLALVHQVYRPPHFPQAYNPLLSCYWPPATKDPVVYLHRFAKFDKDLTRVALGKRFYFHYEGVEFCCGLVRWEHRLVASFGVADREAWLAEIADETVEKTFNKEAL